MADTTTAGQRRTDLALRIARDCDFEATGQLPAPYNPKRQIAAKVLKGTGKVAGKGAVLAGKGAWGVTKWIFVPRPSRRVHIIIEDRSDPFCEAVAVVAVGAIIIGALALVASVGGA